MLTHHDIWQAIDRLAEAYGLSPSGLARKAGLSPTLFNPSKRVHAGRKRWPSTESIAAILRATGSPPEAFIAMASSNAPQHTQLPLLPCKKAAQKGTFTENNLPAGAGWDNMPLPAALDSKAFALEVDTRAHEPAFRLGDKIVLSPAEKPRRGDIVAALTRAGELLIREMGSFGTQKIELLSLLADEPPMTLARKDVVWLYRAVWRSL